MQTGKNIREPYRLFFYSFDCNEPEHVHLQPENKNSKYWLTLLDLGQKVRLAELQPQDDDLGEDLLALAHDCGQIKNPLPQFSIPLDLDLCPCRITVNTFCKKAPC